MAVGFFGGSGAHCVVILRSANRVSKDGAGLTFRDDACRTDSQSFRNTIDAIQPVISAMKAVTRP